MLPGFDDQPLDAASLQLQETQVHGHSRIVGHTSQHALRGHLVLLADARLGGTWRTEHAELPANLVLA